MQLSNRRGITGARAKSHGVVGARPPTHRPAHRSRMAMADSAGLTLTWSGSWLVALPLMTSGGCPKASPPG